MDVAIRMIFIVLISVSGMLINHNIHMKAQTNHYLKEDLEIAVHDAALDVDIDSMRQGQIKFNKTLAHQTFKNSFERNSGLEASQYEIVELVFIESNVEFPYTFESASLDFEDVFFGPTVIAFIKTKSDGYFSDNSSEYVVQPASYTYRINGKEPDLSDLVIGAPNSQGFIWPVPHTRNVTSVYGMRTNPVTGVYKLHAGIDIAAPGVDGTITVAAKSGTVVYAGYVEGYGNLVVLAHENGIETRYAHLATYIVSTGQRVNAGQRIGLVGNTGNSTGPHLHFEVRVDGRPYDPLAFY